MRMRMRMRMWYQIYHGQSAARASVCAWYNAAVESQPIQPNPTQPNPTEPNNPTTQPSSRTQTSRRKCKPMREMQFDPRCYC
jgi:hypothetical protein